MEELPIDVTNALGHGMTPWTAGLLHESMRKGIPEYS